MKTFDKILLKLKNKEINCEEALEGLSKIRHCPNLLNDDNGHWAVSFDGFQNVPIGDDPEDISSTIFVEKSNWKDTIYDALIYSLEN